MAWFVCGVWGNLSLALLPSYLFLLAKFCDSLLLYIIPSKGKEKVKDGSSEA